MGCLCLPWQHEISVTNSCSYVPTHQNAQKSRTPFLSSLHPHPTLREACRTYSKAANPKCLAETDIPSKQVNNDQVLNNVMTWLSGKVPAHRWWQKRWYQKLCCHSNLSSIDASTNQPTKHNRNHGYRRKLHKTLQGSCRRSMPHSLFPFA